MGNKCFERTGKEAPWVEQAVTDGRQRLGNQAKAARLPAAGKIAIMLINIDENTIENRSELPTGR